MPTKMHSTGITFPDLTTQTTAAGSTTQYAIGTYIIGRPANFTTYNNSTIAGSSLYATSANTYYQFAEGSGGFTASTGNTGGSSLINIGSWRCMSIAPGGAWDQYGNGSGGVGLWVRYA